VADLFTVCCYLIRRIKNRHFYPNYSYRVDFARKHQLTNMLIRNYMQDSVWMVRATQPFLKDGDARNSLETQPAGYNQSMD